MDCVVTPLKTLIGFSIHLNVQLKFYNLPNIKQKETCSVGSRNKSKIQIYALHKLSRHLCMIWSYFLWDFLATGMVTNCNI